jgi:hypothetical protein
MPRTETAAVLADDEHVRVRLENWRRHLIDLTYRNRLINYKPTKASSLSIIAPSLDVLLADPGQAEPWRFYFPPEPTDGAENEGDSGTAQFIDEVVVRQARDGHSPKSNEIVVSEPNPKRINRVLDTLAKRSNAEFQDKALRMLYIAAGFLEWTDPAKNQLIRSPLALVPVELRRDTARHPYKMYFVDDEDIVINPSLTEKLRRDGGREIPDDWAWEDKPILTELNEIRSAVAGTGWRVLEEAAVGLFSFQKYVMYRDLLDNEARVIKHPIVRSLAHKGLVEQLAGSDADVPAYEDLDDHQGPKDTLSILDADASQRRCVEAAKLGQSFVMHGPPGTGKSQTIANIIAESIGLGRRVLFVSEKAAALDVVHKRLTRMGLDEYTLMLHGEHAARAEVVAALDRSLTGEIVPRAGMSSTEFERLASSREFLNQSVGLLHEPTPLLGDRSLRDVLAELSTLYGAPVVSGAPSASSKEGADVRREFQQLNEIFQRIAERWRVTPPDFAWRGYRGSHFSEEDRALVAELVASVLTALQQLWERSADIARALGWPLPLTVRASETLNAIVHHVNQAPPLQPHWMKVGFASDLARTVEQAQTCYEALRAADAELGVLFPTRELSDFRPAIGESVDAVVGAMEVRLGRTEAWEQELLPRLPDLIAYLQAADERLANLQERGAEMAALLGQPATERTVAEIEQLAELATLAFHAEVRPEKEWLVQAGLDRATTALDGVRNDLDTYHRLRGVLAERGYGDEALELVDTVGLLQRFTDDHGSALSKLKAAYRRDAKAIRALRGDRKLPDSVIDDLKALLDAQQAGELIDIRADRDARAFGSLFAGRETSVPHVEQALDAAQRARRLASPDSDLDQLARQMCAGSEPATHTALLADQLRAGLKWMRDGAASVAPVSTAILQRLATENLAQLRCALGEALPPLEQARQLIDDLTRQAVTSPASLTELLARGALIDRARTLHATVESNDEKWREVIGGPLAGVDTPWQDVASAAAWLEEFFDLAGKDILPTIGHKLLDATATWPDPTILDAATVAFRKGVARLAALFETEPEATLTDEARTGAFDDLKSRYEQLAAHVDDLYDWTQLMSWRERARQHGWDEFLTRLVEEGISANDVVAAFATAYWNRRLEVFFADEPELADDFRGKTYQRWIDDFRALDRKLVRSGPDRLIEVRNAKRTRHVATEGSEVAKVRDEAGKRRRHRPVRTLLMSIPNLLPELKPCLMMSPLSVSHFLTADHRFDLVIFDEASQVPPQDAINCIYRGEQLIVAGDNEQLPPTSFFQVSETEDLGFQPEEDNEEDMESILDSCKVLLAEQRLLWHYRSRHEDLIAFSNHHIYGDKLVTFPSPLRHTPQLGVSFTYVSDALYDRGRSGTNRREAQVVAQRVVDYLKDGASRSVGVIAFNTQQANAIGEELDRLKIEHPEIEPHFSGDRLDGVFIKHLESVQGDERDVILFSVGFGYDQSGTFPMNFGPLNKRGGKRRLNVAITRAREKVELVASVRAADFKLPEGAKSGPQLLREYLRFAESDGKDALGEEQARHDEYPSPLERDVADVVEELGYGPAPQVGAGRFRIDIGVQDPEDPQHYLLGIQCDGAAYRAVPTARDRDRLREEVLRRLGWRLHRVWSLDWVRNRPHEIERLSEAIETAKRDRDTQAGVANTPTQLTAESQERERQPRVVLGARDVSWTAHLDWVEPYTRVELPAVHNYYDFHESVNRRKQVELLARLVETEAPVHFDYATRRVREAFGYAQSGKKIVAAMRQAVQNAQRDGSVEVRGHFLWRRGQQLQAVRTPDPNDPRTVREIQQIAPEEIDLVIEQLREASPGADDEGLIGQVSRILGFERIGPTIRRVVAERVTISSGNQR